MFFLLVVLKTHCCEYDESQYAITKRRQVILATFLHYK